MIEHFHDRKVHFDSTVGMNILNDSERMFLPFYNISDIIIVSKDLPVRINCDILSKLSQAPDECIMVVSKDVLQVCLSHLGSRGDVEKVGEVSARIPP